jgi:hypothetical protein
VERRGRRRLEVEALHRADAAVGPVRQQHEGHRRAVPVELLLVLPEGAPAAALLAHLPHAGDHVVVLAVGVLALVAGVVPLGPRRDEAGRLGLDRPRREPRPRHAGLGLLGAGELTQRHPHDHHRDGERRQGHGHAGARRRAPAVADEVGDRADHLRNGQAGQEHRGQVVEGQEPPVPQSPLGDDHERDGHPEGGQREEDAGPQPQGDADGGPHQGEAEDPPQVDVGGGVRHQVLPPLVEPRQLGVVVRQLLPPHVVEEVGAQVEGADPPHRQQAPDHEGRSEPAHALGQQPQSGGPKGGAGQQHREAEQRRRRAEEQPGRAQERSPAHEREARDQRRRDQPEPDRHDHGGGAERPERRDDVAEPGEGEQQRSQGAVATRLQPLEHDPQVEQGEAQRDREGELARQRRRDVPAVDREAPVEQEGQRRHREHRGRREPQAGQAPEQVGADREGRDTQHRDELEGHAVGQADQRERHDRPGQRQVATPALGPERRGRAEGEDAGDRGDERGRAVHAKVQQHDQQRRHHHVELVRGEAGIPVPGPPDDLPLGEQRVPQVGGPPHVGTHVAAGGRRVPQQQVGLQVPQDEPDAHQHDGHVDDGVEAAAQVLDPGRVEVLLGQLRPRLVPGRRRHLDRAGGAVRVGVEVGGVVRHGQLVTRNTTVTRLNAMWATMAGPRRPVRWVT